MSRTCAVHTHLSIVPVEVHHVWPRGMGGPDTPANRVTVCSNGHSAVHDLLAHLVRGPVPWSVRRHYGWRIRRLARRGYDQWRAR